jgi:WhiB family redox-sensing transcriptional regulator
MIRYTTLDTSDGWALRGRCRSGDPDALFVNGPRAQREARRVCLGCPVRFECLAHALDNRIEWGVWGGMTEYERRALLRRHPDTPNWRRVVEKSLNAAWRTRRGRRCVV